MKNNLTFIIEKFKLALKENSEYKINLWSAFIINIVVIIILILFFSIFKNLAGDILNWNSYDFLIYTLLILTGSKSHFIFSIRRMKQLLLFGTLNQILSKPINPFIFASVNSLKGPVLIIFPILFISTLILIYFADYSNYLLFLSSFCFGFIIYSLTISFLESFAFFIKENSFLNLFYQESNRSVRLYTPKLFESFSKGFYFFPYALVAYFPLQILKGEVDLFFELLPYFFILFFVLIIAIYFIWKIGLKKYEAFG